MLSDAELDVVRRLPPGDLQSLLDELSDAAPTRAEALLRQLQQGGLDRLDKRGIAEFFGVSEKTIEAWQQRGLPFDKSGRQVWFTPSSCAQWLASQKTLASTKTVEEQAADLAYREEKTRIAQLHRAKLEGKLVDAEAYRAAMHRVLTVVRQGVETYHRRFGNDAVATLEEVIEDAQTMMRREFGEVQKS